MRRNVGLYPVEESCGRPYSKVIVRGVRDTVCFPAAQLAGMLSCALAVVTRKLDMTAPVVAACHYRGQRQMPDLPSKVETVRLEERLI